MDPSATEPESQVTKPDDSEAKESENLSLNTTGEEPHIPHKVSRADFMHKCQSKLYRPEFETGTERSEKLWSLMSEYIDDEIPTIQKSIVNHVEYTNARTRFNFDKKACYLATALSCEIV
jgi:hypothetical protein